MFTNKAVAIPSFIVAVVLIIAIAFSLVMWNTSPSFRAGVRDKLAIKVTFHDLSVAINEFHQSGIIPTTYNDFVEDKDTGKHPLFTTQQLEQYTLNISRRDNIVPVISDIEPHTLLIPKTVKRTAAEASPSENKPITEEPVGEEVFYVPPVKTSYAYLVAIAEAQKPGRGALIQVPEGVDPESPTHPWIFATMAYPTVIFNQK